MSDKRDYYELLGVSRTASGEEIKRAYRNLARKYHPDVNRQQGAEDKFKEINEAYEVLSDDTKRRAFDRFGFEGVNGSGGTGGAGFGGQGMGGFGDIFDIFFGSGGGRSAAGGSMAERGDDLRQDIEVTLEEAVLGIEKTVRYTHAESCDLCGGNGAKPGTTPEVCPSCKGSGYLRQTQNTLLGTFQTTAPCGRCGGQGRVVQSPCPQCTGNGRIRKTRERSIKIPPGVDAGSRIRLVGEGDAGFRGGDAGDLYIVIFVKQHDIFERQGNDLYCEVPLSFARAALGGQITVPIIGGEEKLTISEGTQSGEKFRIRDKGVPDLHGRGRGELYVIVRVQTPTRLSPDQKQLLIQFANSLGEKIDVPDDKGLFGRIFGKS